MKCRLSADFQIDSFQVEQSRNRFFLIFFIFIISFIGILFRLFHVMIIDRESYCNIKKPYIPTETFRADIVDRNGELLATSIPTVSAYAVPRDMINKNEAAKKLKKVFKEIDEKKLEHKLVNSKNFVWVKRHLTPAQEQQVLNLGILGVYFIKTERRVYPDKNLCSHILGFTDVDNNGIAGIEKSMNSVLSSSNDPLKLSVDLKIQHAVRDEIKKSIEKFKAIAGACVVLNIKTGEVISLVSLPDFDPNIVKDPSSKENFNLITSSALEPGSSAKIINTALLLEHGGLTTNTKFDARYPIKIGKHTINDYHGKYTFLTIEEIFKYSSNIGSAKMLLEVGEKKQKEFFKTLGLLDQFQFELNEIQKPIYPKNWTEVSAITISYGHGIAINPLQYVMSIGGLLNGGVMNNPTLIKCENTNNRIGRRIVSEHVSKQLCYLLRINVLEGSNKKAEAKGYLVGAKTGTAEKNKGGRYLKKSNYSCIVSAFPMPNPEYIVYVILDDAQATKETFGFAAAGWNAAPTASEIIKRIANMLGISESNNLETDWKMLLTKNFSDKHKLRR